MNARTGRLIGIGLAAFLTPLVVGFAVLFGILQRRAEPEPYDPRVRHRVTPQMASLTERMATKTAPGFTAPGSDGKQHSLAQLLERGPVLLTFVNVECPCSRDAEPMFQAFADDYTGLTVVGIVGAPADKAWLWGRDNRVRHLLLADPDLKAVHAYGAVSSVTTALVTAKGKIVKMWPGYSQSMMGEVAGEVADLLGVRPQSLSAKLAPAEMAAGCAFPTY